MSYSNRNASASSSRAPQQIESSGRDVWNIPVPTGTKNEPYLWGESKYEGTLVPRSYTTDECRLEDERVQFQLDDGRIVGAESKGAKSLREMVGKVWDSRAVFYVTLHGESNFIKRVAVKVEVKGDELEELLAEM